MFPLYVGPGADLGFFRGGADFQECFESFDDLFFLGRPNWFSELF